MCTVAAATVVFVKRRCYRRRGTVLALETRMAAKSLADRVAALEAKVGDKTFQEQFREQAELIDRLFIYRFEEFDKHWDAKFDAKLAGLESRLEAKLEQKLEQKLETKLEAKLEEKLGPIRVDLVAVRDAVQVILARLT
jgi:7,8-dihydro-6-hydroxymethylpterin-pyrophosphokinase